MLVRAHQAEKRIGRKQSKVLGPLAFQTPQNLNNLTLAVAGSSLRPSDRNQASDSIGIEPFARRQSRSSRCHSRAAEAAVDGGGKCACSVSRCGEPDDG
jgi:hypothetical protein